MGSVKDLKILKEATVDEAGRGRFLFSDRYSVFDWGEMPDQIVGKGSSIAVLGAHFFEKLEKMRIPTHYRGLVENGAAKRLLDLKGSASEMEIKLLRVVRPVLEGDRYDYSMYKNGKGVLLIPLEVIYRNSLPAGSSVFRRLMDGRVTLKELGIDHEPTPGDELDPPILDVSTKLEITDRYLTWDEAREISGLSGGEIADLKDLTMTANRVITDEFGRIGLKNEDGKIEVGFNEGRKLMVVDVIGTLDECRFTYDGIPVSKEIARIYYRKTDWYRAVEEAKKADRQNWKRICRLKPEPLPKRFAELISQIYMACTNEITGREWFKNTPPLEKVLSEIEKFIG